MFLNGQKVVCIDDVFAEVYRYLFTVFPKAGEVYTVRGMSPALCINGAEEIAVYLEELHNPRSTRAPFRERGYKVERFAPLEELTESEILNIKNNKPQESTAQEA